MTMTPNKQDKQSPWWKWIFIALGLLVVIVGVPIGINECYKANTGYITVWNGADVLSYYGTIISTIIAATIAILTMVATILFTRKQIQRETYLKAEQEKWEKIENLLAQALERINPKRILLVSTDALTEDDKNYLNSSLSAIQKYQFDCRVATDYLYSYIGSSEYSRMESLLDKIQDSVKKFYDIAQEEFDLYLLMRKVKARDLASRLVKNEAQLPNILTDEERGLIFSTFEQAKDLKADSIQAELEKTSAKMVESYETVYRPLLAMKRQTFDTIYTEIQKNADDILRFRRKNHANP